MGPGYWWGYGYGWFWIFPLLCMIFMVAMAVMMFRRGGCMPMRRGSSEASCPSRIDTLPLRQILDRRLASGELTREQYDAMRRTIEAPGASRGAT